MTVESAYERGTKVRRAVLGDAHVDRAIARTTRLDADFQRFITESAWGSVWSRPGLSRRERSMLVIALMAALGHEEELAMHLRATRNTGASPADIAETLLVVAVYAGAPAANTAFRIAKEVLGAEPAVAARAAPAGTSTGEV
jgi:4-carboxymuconolactone decarboxylase